MQVEQTYFIGSEDTGADNAMSDKFILEALGNTACKHATLSGQGVDDRDQNHLAWVVTNWKIEVLSRPRMCETVKVRTWIQQSDRLLSKRDFELYNDKDQLIARASSVWMAINLNTQFLTRITPALLAPYEPEPEHTVFPADAVFTDLNTLSLPAENFDIYTIPKAMIDCNAHVHNSSYLDIAMQVLPEGPDTLPFDHLQISYKKEIKPRATIKLEYARSEGRHYVFFKGLADDTLHAVLELY